MSKDKKRVTKSIDGEMYYIPDYVRFLYKNLYERNHEIERLNNIIEGIDDIIKNHYIVGHTVQNASIDSILKEIKELKENKYEPRG